MNTFQKVSTVFGAIVLAAPLSLYAGHTNAVLEANLDGGQEVPTAEQAIDINKKSGKKMSKKVGDKNGYGKAYVFGIDGDPKTLCYFLEVGKIQLVPVGKGMAAHIHKGQEYENGPVVANLAGPEDGNAADCITEGEKGKFPTGETVQSILSNPNDYYINVHNPKFPNGAIRGQLTLNLEEDDHVHEAPLEAKTNG